MELSTVDAIISVKETRKITFTQRSIRQIGERVFVTEKDAFDRDIGKLLTRRSEVKKIERRQRKDED